MIIRNNLSYYPPSSENVTPSHLAIMTQRHTKPENDHHTAYDNWIITAITVIYVEPNNLPETGL